MVPNQMEVLFSSRKQTIYVSYESNAGNDLVYFEHNVMFLSLQSWSIICAG